MTVSTIYQDAEGQIFTEGRHLAIAVDGQVYATLHDPSRFTGLSERQLIDAAGQKSKVTAPRLKKKILVAWPDLKAARGEWPDARVVKAGKTSYMPRATTVHWRSPAGKREKTRFRSMKAARDATGLTPGQFEAIAHKSPGFKAHMLPLMSGVEVHSPDYKHPDKAHQDEEPQGPLFMIKEVKTGFNITYIGPKKAPKISDIPMPVIVNSVMEK
jgi:hypothetical protein